MSKKQKESLVPLISTLIVAVLAIAMAIVAMLLLKGGNDNDTSNTSGNGSSYSEPSFQPTEQFRAECETAIPELVEGNSRIISMFITNGLAHEAEPYGNAPVDGLYTVADAEYKTLQQIEDYVRSIYIDAEADRILTNINGSGLAVYQARKKLVKVEETNEGTAESTTDGESVHYAEEYVLGISAEFVDELADKDYDRNWLDLNYSYDPITETECDITLYFNGYDPSVGTAEALPEDVLELKMVKVSGEWRLTALAY